MSVELSKKKAMNYREMSNYMDDLQRIGFNEEKNRSDVIAHEMNVADVTRKLARHVGMSSEEASILALAARYHDVGKTMVPDSVFRKPGRLVGDEWKQMQMHAMHGYKILSEVDDLPKVFLDVSRYHHERYDGMGYEGLKGEEIPFSARLVSIADVYDALVAKRDYKASMDPEMALSIMVADRPGPELGRRAFDPVLMRKFIRMHLNDPSFVCSEENRDKFMDYVSSDPALDLDGDLSIKVKFDEDGNRDVYMVGGDGEVEFVESINASGSTVSGPVVEEYRVRYA